MVGTNIEGILLIILHCGEGVVDVAVTGFIRTHCQQQIPHLCVFS